MQFPLTATQQRVLLLGSLSALVTLVVGARVVRFERTSEPYEPPPAEPVKPDPLAPVRALPDRFPRNTYMPKEREGSVSGSIDMGTFSAGRDLLYVDDPRIWWESDHDKGDEECDHSMHRAVELPLRRLVELVAARDGTLEVHDAYRPKGIHNPRSLHREGRAIDVTCDELGLEELARLCWAAGFDWVYHEAKARGGAHVHCSVKRPGADTLPRPRPDDSSGPYAQ